MKLLRLPMLLLLSLTAAGCGGGAEMAGERPETVPAEGTLFFNGQPVGGATIVLAPATGSTPGAGYGASAVTDEDGEFTLSAFPPDEGVVPGKYLVSVTKLEVVQQTAPPEAHDETPAPPPKHLLPEKFADPLKSGVSLDIPKDGNEELKIELK